MKKYKNLSLSIVISCVMGVVGMCSLHAVPVMKCKSVFGSSPYTLLVFDIREYLEPYVRSFKIPDRGVVMMLHPHGGTGNEVSRYVRCACKSLEKFGEMVGDGDENKENTRFVVKKYDTRVAETLDKIDAFKGREVQLCPPSGNVVYGNYLVPAIVRDGSMDVVHPRANLFDMVTPVVDHVLDCGIAEHVADKNCKGAVQISLLCALVGTLQDGSAYSYLGLLQCTFDDQGICCHRAFRPWTKAHLMSVSNSKTQWLMRLVLSDFLESYIDGTLEEPAYSALASVFNEQTEIKDCIQTLDAARYACGDAKWVKFFTSSK
jgi:hypothetical protein